MPNVLKVGSWMIALDPGRNNLWVSSTARDVVTFLQRNYAVQMVSDGEKYVAAPAYEHTEETREIYRLAGYLQSRIDKDAFEFRVYQNAALRAMRRSMPDLSDDELLQYARLCALPFSNSVLWQMTEIVRHVGSKRFGVLPRFATTIAEHKQLLRRWSQAGTSMDETTGLLGLTRRLLQLEQRSLPLLRPNVLEGLSEAIDQFSWRVPLDVEKPVSSDTIGFGKSNRNEKAAPSDGS